MLKNDLDFEFYLNGTILNSFYRRSKFPKSPKIPKFGNIFIGSFWLYDIEKVILGQDYGDSLRFFI